MRWQEQSVDHEDGRLPGLSGAVRSWSPPDYLDIRFHEVHAKSALNRVPAASRVPFEWTINPYRGCLHACTYCAAGDTPILMGDGSTKPLERLRPGDVIYGTRPEGRYRRCTRTVVKDHWSSLKPAFRTVLADGTELVTSGDHRFLTERGWKHVLGPARAHLTMNNSLLGVGRFAAPPADRAEYRRGYLCGIIRGDGHVGHYEDQRPGRTRDTHHRFRLALADPEALDRTEGYLAELAIRTDRFTFARAAGARREVRAIRTAAGGAVERFEQLIAWPLDPCDDWRKGFLAGIFDAEGSCSRGVLRISNGDASILGWIEACLRHFGFSAVVEPPAANGVRSVRLRGGLRERLRFFHLTGPAIARKCELEGTALKSDAGLRVVAVEPLGRAMRLYDITTGTGDYISNGVVSHNCFARPTHEFLEWNAGTDFERQIVVKVNLPEVLRAELARPSWEGDHVALGTNTDPYQWVEKRYGLMRGVWEAMRDFSNPCSILTKSPLLLRDADLMAQIAERTHFSACLSIPTLDEKAWRATEPHTPNPRARLEAVKELNRLGIPTGVLVAPLMPGINDAPEQVERLLEAIAEAGAVSVGGQALFLRGATRDVFMAWLRDAYPELVDEYEQLYRNRAFLRPADKARIEAPLVDGCRDHRINARFKRPRTAAEAERPRTAAEAERPRTAAEAATRLAGSASTDPPRGRPPQPRPHLPREPVQTALF